jgi:hypothetical protein
MKFPRIFVTPDGEPRFGEPLALGLATALRYCGCWSFPIEANGRCRRTARALP